MVEIKKGRKTLAVPAGAVRKYITAGWELAGSSKSEKTAQPYRVKAQAEDESLETDDTQNDEDVEYVDPEELAERPLNELDTEELRILAEYKGIDVSELRTAKKLRAALENLE